ncbi:hypothetical protein XENOCAPTIV_011267 [Xenoophorus captivus]|uniref:Secreted protein n=1 Tax=Xenoophorus captivus TaxID=1517983 RepID=A0ABV0QHP5_9TELE
MGSSVWCRLLHVCEVLFCLFVALSFTSVSIYQFLGLVPEGLVSWSSSRESGFSCLVWVYSDWNQFSLTLRFINFSESELISLCSVWVFYVTVLMCCFSPDPAV